jgi:DNA-binding response OmpR family regulator
MISLSASNGAVVVTADEPRFRQELRESLENNGYRVVEVPDFENGSLTERLRSDVLSTGRMSEFLLPGREKPLAIMIVSGAPAGDLAENRSETRRRAHRPKHFRWGPLFIDFDDRQVLVAGQQVLLTHTEHSFLCILAEQAGKLVPTRQIIRKLWGSATSGRLSCLRVHACSLRRKLTNPLISKLILTDHGLGYRLASLEQIA